MGSVVHITSSTAALSMIIVKVDFVHRKDDGMNDFVCIQCPLRHFSSIASGHTHTHTHEIDFV